MQDAEEISEEYSSDGTAESESLDANLEERCNNWNIPIVPGASNQSTSNRRAPGVLQNLAEAAADVPAKYKVAPPSVGSSSSGQVPSSVAPSPHRACPRKVMVHAATDSALCAARQPDIAGPCGQSGQNDSEWEPAQLDHEEARLRYPFASWHEILSRYPSYLKLYPLADAQLDSSEEEKEEEEPAEGEEDDGTRRAAVIEADPVSFCQSVDDGISPSDLYRQDDKRQPRSNHKPSKDAEEEPWPDLKAQSYSPQSGSEKGRMPMKSPVKALSPQTRAAAASEDGPTTPEQQHAQYITPRMRSSEKAPQPHASSPEEGHSMNGLLPSSTHSSSGTRSTEGRGVYWMQERSLAAREQDVMRREYALRVAEAKYDAKARQLQRLRRRLDQYSEDLEDGILLLADQWRTMRDDKRPLNGRALLGPGASKSGSCKRNFF
mmetsp:Transcript_67032/g.125244  ORF Transcript_67032/g.125244 Transcript_67032/m.125244 type:complete len:435 (-) Transcript_67032:9-1313(-)